MCVVLHPRDHTSVLHLSSVKRQNSNHQLKFFLMNASLRFQMPPQWPREEHLSICIVFIREQRERKRGLLKENEELPKPKFSSLLQNPSHAVCVNAHVLM